LWKHREIGSDFKTGCFVEDATGRWFATFTVEVPNLPKAPKKSVGIDLGLKTTATLSNGHKIEAKRFYRNLEPKLAIAQRSHNKKRVKAIHHKIANQRKHFLHVESNKITNKFRNIVVGDVSSTKLAKTRMAKSVFDAGWYMFKCMLKYKASRHQGTFIEVNEAWTTQTCSACGSCNSEQRPKGIADLGIREWKCECGVTHDRDVNASLNILALGLEHQPLVGGSPNL
jgi:IS605 OrfB family transposase